MSEGADNAQSPTERRATAEASSLQRSSAPTSPPSIDDETAAALTLYNAYLVADREQQAHERALRKAQKAKDDAAAAVRKLNERKAPASETAAAEAKYRDAVEALQRLRDGDTAAPAGDDDKSDEAADDTTSDEAAPAENEDTTADTAEEADDTTSDEAAPAEDEDTTAEDTEDATAQDADDTDKTDKTDKTEDTTSENAEETASVGVEASVGDDDLAGDEPAGVTG